MHRALIGRRADGVDLGVASWVARIVDPVGAAKSQIVGLGRSGQHYPRQRYCGRDFRDQTAGAHQMTPSLSLCVPRKHAVPLR